MRYLQTKKLPVSIIFETISGYNVQCYPWEMQNLRILYGLI